jgi:hypothetical protein
VHGSPVVPSVEKKGLRFDVKVLAVERPGKTSRCDFVFLWLLSASTCICAQCSREVHRAPTSDGIPRRRTEPCSPPENCATAEHDTLGFPPTHRAMSACRNSKLCTCLLALDCSILRVPIYCPVTSTMRKRALPCIMRPYASAACSSGNVSIMGRIFSRTLNASVSSLSIGVPVSVP